MWIGNNRLVFNHATMEKAVEEYVNHRLVGTKIKVTSICAVNSEFVCHVQPQEQGDETKR